ncbi:P22 phage major capsid protein family protein [Nocardia carnea]|uniref:P22 phage major capsid protein family protein n=1 Tax=Nocardia carnea TaxID=37328 RepID=UPI002454A2F6|nr:P22 phage major capsid protein family protein [Nocardia carnea]
MAIGFIAEFWADQVLVPFDQALIFGQPKVANRNYEGEIREQGDTVHVSTIGDPAVRAYDKTTDMTTDQLSDDTDTMLIDQGEYFSFYVNDVEKVQAAANFDDPALSRAGAKLQNAADLYLYGLLKAGVLAANQLGRVTVVDAKPEVATVGQTDMYTVLVKLREKLDRQSVPKAGRYAALSPELVSPLLLDERFVHADKLGATPNAPLLNGQIGRVAGFDILESNNINKVGGSGANKDDYVIVAGVNAALSFANQIQKVERIRAQSRFADIVRGLNIYGGHVFRGEALASASVLLAPPAPPTP